MSCQPMGARNETKVHLFLQTFCVDAFDIKHHIKSLESGNVVLVGVTYYLDNYLFIGFFLESEIQWKAPRGKTVSIRTWII